MSVEAVNNSQNSMYFEDSKREPKSILGKDDFLMLMMKQMQYQDPLNPMDNNAYIAQMAQLSSLEQMTNMAQSFTMSQAFSLIGKQVKAQVLDEKGLPTEITGKVDKADVDGSTITLTVGGSEVSLDSITEVMDNDVAAS